MKNPKLQKEYPKFLSNKWDLRIYYTVEEDFYRFHFGFPENLVKPLCPLLECSPYWGEQHWIEVDGFWLWWLPYREKTNKPKKEKLNSWLKFYLSQYNMCLRFLTK